MNQAQRNKKKFDRENRKYKGVNTARKIAAKNDAVRARRRLEGIHDVDSLLSIDPLTMLSAGLSFASSYKKF